jgi:hypothetical protein
MPLLLLLTCRGRGETLEEAAAQPSPGFKPVLESKNEGNANRAQLVKPENGAKGMPSHAAAHTFSHSASKWDKFDVDAALAEVSDTSDSESKGAGEVEGKQSAEAVVHDRESKDNLTALHTTRTVSPLPSDLLVTRPHKILSSGEHTQQLLALMCSHLHVVNE